MKPVGAQFIESDGTFWKNENGQWFFLIPGAKQWSPYIGPVTQTFLKKMIQIGEGDAVE